MKVYNDLFYDKGLKAFKDVDSVEAQMLKHLSAILPNTHEREVTQGIIFCGVEGKSETCFDSPSWQNKAEAESVSETHALQNLLTFNCNCSQVKGFVLKLYKMRCNAADIGIITPYIKQVKTIRSLLERADLPVPKIGTVEEFQGQERKIILLSTVRTLRAQLKFDEKFSLGFIKNPKRMNVAISRARALLVVFGSPKLLSRDENWRYLIKHCIENKCAVDCDPNVVKCNDDDD